MNTNHKKQVISKFFATVKEQQIADGEAKAFVEKLQEFVTNGQRYKLRQAVHNSGQFDTRAFKNIVEPYYNHHHSIVTGYLSQAKDAKSFAELEQFKLPHPVVPKAYTIWRRAIESIRESIAAKLLLSNISLSNKVIVKTAAIIITAAAANFVKRFIINLLIKILCLIVLIFSASIRPITFSVRLS